MDNCVPDSPTCKQLVQLGACGKMVWIQLHQFFECKERHWVEHYLMSYRCCDRDEQVVHGAGMY